MKDFLQFNCPVAKRVPRSTPLKIERHDLPQQRPPPFEAAIGNQGSPHLNMYQSSDGQSKQNGLIETQDSRSARPDASSTTEAWHSLQNVSQDNLAERTFSALAGSLDVGTKPDRLDLEQRSKESTSDPYVVPVGLESTSEKDGVGAARDTAAMSTLQGTATPDRKNIATRTALSESNSPGVGISSLIPPSTIHLQAADGERAIAGQKAAAQDAPLRSLSTENRSLHSAQQQPSVSAGSTRLLEVGLESGTNGWLKVRAESDGRGEISASLIATTGNAVEALHKELPALTAYLKDQAVTVSSLAVHRADSGGPMQGASTGRQDSFSRSEGKEGQQAGSDRRVHETTDLLQHDLDHPSTGYFHAPQPERVIARSSNRFVAVA